MGAPDLLAKISAAGLTVEASGDKLLVRPRNRLTPELQEIIQAHKPELLAALAANDPFPDPAAEARRQRVQAMLAANPGIRYAVLTDTQADPDAVLLTLAIRGHATCELAIPRAKYDPLLLLDLIERHGGTMH